MLKLEGQPARVMIVDDEAVFRRGVARTLEQAGYAVVEAKDGDEMIELFKKRPADLVVTDVYMPGTDGIEALIRIQKEHPNVKAIVMSGGGHMKREDVLDLAKRVGAKSTLAKPFDSRALVHAVAVALMQKPKS